jgi:hypothetical protein
MISKNLNSTFINRYKILGKQKIIPLAEAMHSKLQFEVFSKPLTNRHDRRWTFPIPTIR